MIGAKVNNRIVPIDHKVQTGEIIEIITGSENRGPSRDWLNIVKTSEAKNKIRNWFKKERREENIQEGRDALEREMRRNLMTMTDEQHDVFMEALARRNRCNSVEEMYAAIGYGGLQISRMLPKLKEEYTKLQATEPKPVTVELKRMHSSDGVIVEGIDNCPIKFAKCCSPLPGDEIIGFVTRGFGVSIHKRDCANARESMRHPENADRWVRAYWDEAEKENYKATLDIVCMDRANLVSDVALALGDMRVPIYSLTARAAEQGRARMGVTVGITNTEHLNSVVARLKKIKDVVSVTRNWNGRRYVGAAHVRPATVWQTFVCLSRQGRACPAPTVQLILKRSNYLCEQLSSASPAQALPSTGASPGPSGLALSSCWACAIPTTAPLCPSWPKNAPTCAFLRTRTAS